MHLSIFMQARTAVEVTFLPYTPYKTKTIQHADGHETL